MKLDNDDRDGLTSFLTVYVYICTTEQTRITRDMLGGTENHSRP